MIGAREATLACSYHHLRFAAPRNSSLSSLAPTPVDNAVFRKLDLGSDLQRVELEGRHDDENSLSFCIGHVC